MMSLNTDHEQPLFTFAIVTDTHIRPPGGDDSSPFPVNELANDRARYAIAAIARHAPEFTVHLGDMVHPLPHLPTFAAAANEALEIFEPLRDQMRFVPGNHDVGDKPMAGAPAGAADDENTRIYEKFFGPSFYAYGHGGIHIIVVNASLINSGSQLEAAQREWLESEFTAHDGERIFLFSHYPPFINTPDEPVHYDNYDEPGRGWLLALIERYGVEAVFSGHAHQFFYNRRSGTKFYCLPATSFTRQDYSELYDVGPAPEYGRNDTGKFSYALIDVFETGHRLRVVPTEGRMLGAGAALDIPDPVSVRPAPAPVVVHMRHAWARATDLPYNGPMEEFARKRARDDYVLLRLWQMGVSHVRTPLSDLTDTEYGPRVGDYQASGIRFTFFCAGVAAPTAWAACKENAAMIDAVEFVSNTANLSDIADDLAAFDASGGPPVHLGKFHSSAHEPRRGSKFAHSVSYGFKWEDREVMLTALRDADTNGTIGGVAFQVNLEDDLSERLPEMDEWAEHASLSAVAVIRLANVNPAEANFDDAAIARRVTDAIEVAGQLKRVTLQLDTYMDIDRAYHPRHGLLDRRSNFREAGRFLAARRE